ncbi:MAG TPA: T9SS type A sorting domain-containing protein [Puia sp.]|jgi:hypothetical protein
MKRARQFIVVVIPIFLSSHASAVNRYWVSILGGNWNNTLSWASSSGGLPGASVPAAGDAVIFDGGSFLGIRKGNCTINTTVNVSSMEIDARYTGTISQGANSITIAGTATLGGGTFAGGTGNITVGSTFTLSATAFTSTSATLELNGDAAFTGGTFTHNNGLVKFNGTASQTISGTSPGLYDLEFVGTGHVYTLSSAGDIGVVNRLAISGSSSCTLTSGQLDVSGNIVLTNTSTGDGGTSTININGSGNQAISSALLINQSTLPSVNISKTGGTLTLPAIITVMGNWTYTSGTLDVTTNNSTVVFDNSLSITGSHTLNNVTFEGNNNWIFTFNTGTVLTVAGTLTTTGASNIFINDATAGATALQAQGDILIGNSSTTGGGTGQILINGTASQTFSSTVAAGQGWLPFIKIQKTSGTLTLGGTTSVSRDWTYVSGAVAPTSSTIVFGGNNLSISSAGMSFNNVNFISATGTLTSSLSVNNDLSITGTAILSAGSNTINLSGNWTDRSSAGFTEASSTLNFSGSVLQSITVPGGENFTNIMLNNGSGIRLVNSVSVSSNLTMAQGDIDLNGNSVTLGSSAVLPGTLNYTSGTMINTGFFIRWFRTGIIAEGSADGLFPVGTRDDYRPVYVSAPASGPAVGGTIAISYTDASANSLVSIADPPFTVSVQKNLNWSMNTSGLVGGSYNIQVQGTNFGQIGLPPDLRLTLASSVVGTAGTNAGTPTNPQVNRTALTAANLTNTFYLGSVNPLVTTLPITLISFTAIPENNQVKLSWETAGGGNNNYNILRSQDGVHWQKILGISGSGNTNTDSKHSVVDTEPYSGISYYRLELNDGVGKESLSMICAVSRDAAISLTIFPNPTTGLVFIRGADKMQMSLLNSSGQQIKVAVLANGNSVILNFSQLPGGIYFLHLWDNGKSFLKAIVRE